MENILLFVKILKDLQKRCLICQMKQVACFMDDKCKETFVCQKKHSVSLVIVV